MWIEICGTPTIFAVLYVAPFAGVWIEIRQTGRIKRLYTVAPFAGVWIEIYIAGVDEEAGDGRSLRGSVD